MRSKFTDKKKRSYGIFGLGSARLAIALANYYCSYLKKKVVLGEVGDGGMADIATDTYSGIKSKSFVRNNMVGFTRMKVDYYPALSEEEALHLLEEDVDVVILEFKIMSHDYMNLFRLCSRRLFLGDIASYNKRSLCCYLHLFEHDMVEVEIYTYAVLKDDKKWYEDTYKDSKYSGILNIARIITNPDRLTKEDISFLGKIGC